ncbi:unnamed protein product [Diatraea saccharalis]|uniref:Carboxylesterase type B domain-containing protein n=1 Tax=Diatraea saccharalis TaxID=40085 RepID=A0A9N9RAY9_9NEOP|nr:unnamed protein product [Diatraea saccharalis]
MSVVYLVFLFLFVNACHGVLVHTAKGPVRGQDAGYYRTFFGVPYALVDKSNPFGVSLPYPDFTTPFAASDSSIKCPQAVFTAEGILQCLRLNIYVPKTSKRNLPVLVWFHGGGFLFGSAGEYDGKYLVKHEIIVVTANYRMGPYGFFCLETEDIPGNQGLRDQVTALRWIKNNIAAFGGNPNDITISGESYGGGAVELHLYSENEKLFNKAIIQSGAADEEAMYLQPDSEAAFNLAKVFNPSVTKDGALDLLAKQDPIELMIAFNATGKLLRVCKEKKFRNGRVENFITTNSSQFFNLKKVSGTPIMIGYNSKETFNDFVIQPDEFYDENQDFIEKKIRDNYKLSEEELKREANRVKRFYLGNRNISKDVMLELIDFMSDFFINHPEEKAVTRFLNQNTVVYKYLFSYIGNSPYKNVTGVGAYHTEELQYLFEWSEAGVLSGDENLKMRDRMTAMWANFVKHGKPTTCKTDLLPVKWEQALPNNRAYLNIDKEMKMGNHVYKKRMDFWDNFWKIHEKDYVFQK